jgi:hypothetical protein
MCEDGRPAWDSVASQLGSFELGGFIWALLRPDVVQVGLPLALYVALATGQLSHGAV